MLDPIDCHVYRSKLKKGMYIYLVDKDNFDSIPENLKDMVGTLEFTFSMTLHESKKLVRQDTKTVITQLQTSGYYLQMPPANTNFLDLNLKQSDGF